MKVTLPADLLENLLRFADLGERYHRAIEDACRGELVPMNEAPTIADSIRQALQQPPFTPTA